MLPYWLMFGLSAIGALHYGDQRRQTSIRGAMIAIAALFALMIGLRLEVGADWINYQNIYRNLAHLDLGDAIGQVDPGYAFLNWLAARLGAGVWFANLVCAILFMIGVARLCMRQHNPMLAMLVATPYLIIVVAMGYTRQGAAIGLVCFALASRDPNRLLKAAIAVCLATLMHKTAILALPIMLIPTLRHNVVLAAAGAVVFATVFYFALRGSAEGLLNQYVEGSYDSQGALIRVLMNVVCAGVFLAFRRRFGFDAFNLNYWTICSLLAILSLVAVFVLPSTSGIDRLALFLIPLQMVVLARLPYLQSPDRPNRELLVLVVLYSAAVQGVWLTQAQHAEAWLPYRMVVGSWFGE